MIHIKFTDGSNPYILTNESLLYKWFYNYDLELNKIAEGAIFFVTATETARRKTYQQAKGAAQMFAIDAQNEISKNAFSYGEIADIADTLHALGSRFGLVREFKENCIC
jgi:hypothetical protein